MADIFHQRALNVIQDQGLTALDCIGWLGPTGDMGLRIFFKTGSEPTRFKKAGQGCVTVTDARSVNGGLVIAGTTPAAADLAEADSVTMALTDGQITLPVQPPETNLFDGLNMCVAERNGEPLEVIEEWISYHVAQFGLQGLLLIDRADPEKLGSFTKRLKRVANRSKLRTLVHLTSTVPLGREDLPPASHPFNAPDAPGKDRMGELTPDAWSAPLAELQLYELIKWRFASKARAVMNLDLTDLLQLPAKGAAVNPFDTVHDSSAGVIQLVGQRIYPWRVRPKESPRFADHICRQFDNPRANRRWCVSPARLGSDKMWRFVRIVDANPQPGETAPFWRAMAIRHPGNTAAEIVPKTSLIEDRALIKQAKALWGHKPVRAPANKLENAPAQASKAGRTLIVTCMKNEGPFILEWIAYHRAIGVDDFLVYTNDCTDGTDELLNLLQERGIVQRRDNKFHGTGVKPQHWALAASDKEKILKKAGWVISMDVDEFLNIHVGQGRLDDLYKAVGDANMISATWRLFGNADVHAYEDKFLIDQFDQCAPELCRKPHQAWGFKTLFRNIGIYKKMGVHRPKGLKPDLWDQIKWVNGSGKPMPQKLIRNGWRSTTDSYGYDMVTLNHYAVRSAESFLVKRDRGRVNHVDRDQGLSYWFRMNNNWEQDRSILSKRDLLVAEFDRLMADPEISAAHQVCVDQHKAKIAELKATKNYARFYEELASDRMERLSRMHTHFGANVFLAGPQSVPDEVAFKDDVEPDFFFTVAREKTKH